MGWFKQEHSLHRVLNKRKYDKINKIFLYILLDLVEK